MISLKQAIYFILQDFYQDLTNSEMAFEVLQLNNFIKMPMAESQSQSQFFHLNLCKVQEKYPFISV